MAPERADLVIVLVTFAVVIVIIAMNLLDMAVAALLGIGALIIVGQVRLLDVINAIRSGGGSMALLFGGMVVARMLAPTGLFEVIGVAFLRLTGGSGRRLLLGLFALVAPVCAFLPNATTVILLAPVIVRVCRALEIDFVVPLILTAIISNSAGMLTLVGDPAAFLIGDAVGYTFTRYLQEVSLGGFLAMLSIVFTLPILAPEIWRLRRKLPANLPPARLDRPWFAAAALVILATMVVMFVLGDALPNPIVPPAVAILAAAAALLLIQGSRSEEIAKILVDVDWKTLLFLGCIFVMVEDLGRTGLFSNLSTLLFDWFGRNPLWVGIAMLVGVGIVSSLLANVPVAVAMTAVLKGYFVVAGLVPEDALGVAFKSWPAFATPVFVAVMFGATLGGNATMVGASANIVSVGICAANGKTVTFARFVRYGLPITVLQLLVGGLYFVAISFFAPAPN